MAAIPRPNANNIVNMTLYCRSQLYSDGLAVSVGHNAGCVEQGGVGGGGWGAVEAAQAAVAAGCLADRAVAPGEADRIRVK